MPGMACVIRKISTAMAATTNTTCPSRLTR
ncbi:Uncharacterised protein [Bordetella pertussis]|nr:Uncharacterised protein [Bordetella pertussis]CFW38349.1 Uncharacterised protein [Bordetella pertussis]